MRCVHFCVSDVAIDIGAHTRATHRCRWRSRWAGAAPCLRSSRARHDLRFASRQPRRSIRNRGPELPLIVRRHAERRRIRVRYS